MLLRSYRKHIFRNKCMPGAATVQCHAELDQDVTEALPYLNASLGGDTYTLSPPSVTFRTSGKLITVHGKKIAVNALKDEEEADKIIRWLQRETNEAWDNRRTIVPSCKSAPQPRLIEILKRLPKTNCGKCGEPTCMVFAARISEGVKAPDQCPDIGDDEKRAVQDYMAPFGVS
jgi:ArsR family metal-binding transcriptional regulator